jgi:hypothetical protein
MGTSIIYQLVLSLSRALDAHEQVARKDGVKDDDGLQNSYLQGDVFASAF